MDPAIGIDLGGTRIKAVAIDTDGNILHQLYTNTNDGDGAVWKNAVKETVKELLQRLQSKSTRVGISAPGLPDDQNKGIASMPGRMQGLEGLIWKDFLHQVAYVINDGVAALMAEAKFGSARKKKTCGNVNAGNRRRWRYPY